MSVIMKFGLSEAEHKAINAVFAADVRIAKVWLFGSRAKGTHREGSDIDLAIKADGYGFADLLRLMTQLDALGMLYHFDVQDHATITDAALLEHIARMGQVIYTRD